MKNYIPGNEYHSWKKINLTPDWIKYIPHNPIPVLIRNSPPAVRLFIAKDVLGLPDRHPLITKIQKHIPHEKAFKKLIQESEKTEKKILKNEYELLFLNLLERLHQYIYNGANIRMYPIKSEIIKIMDTIDENGRFPLLYHHHAHACWVLIKLGLEGNRLLDKSILWIMNRQRNDGGWLHRSMVQKGKTYEKQSSCIWTTVEILQLLTSRKSFTKSEQVMKSIKFIENKLFHDSSTNFLKSNMPWDTFSIGKNGDSIFTGGSVKILDSIVTYGLGFKHPLVDRLYKGLLFTQLSSGYFPLIKSKKPIGDAMVTVRILSIFRKLNMQKS